MDILITIPKRIPWSEYQKELDAVADWSQVMNFKVNNFPTQTNIGDKCYVVYDGYIIGYQKIVGMVEHSFTCSTTGKKYSGKFIQRSGPFHKITPKPCKGFQGYKYA